MNLVLLVLLHVLEFRSSVRREFDTRERAQRTLAQMKGSRAGRLE